MKTLTTPVGLLRCWDADDITRSLEAGEFWDEHLKETFDQTPYDGWAIDLGANIGFFTAYFAQRFQHVLAVEAHPQTYALLRDNIRALGIYLRASAVLGAAYDTYTTVELASSKVHGWTEEERSFLDTDSAKHSAGYTFVEDPTQQHPLHEWKVPTVIVDDLIPLDATVRLIKVDVQGAALRALKGCSTVIARCRPRIVFEFEQHVSECRGDFWPAYLRFFEERDYTVQPIAGPWEDFLAVPR